jgi:hypothetical protein
MTQASRAPMDANWRVGAPADPDSANRDRRAGEAARAPGSLAEARDP